MNKNIWIINQYAGSPYHGMGYRTYYLAKEFVKNGYSVKIISGSYSHQFQKLPNTKGLFTSEIIDDIEYIWVKVPKYKNSTSAGRVLSMFVFFINLFLFNPYKYKKPDVIIVSSLSLFPIVNGYIWSKLLKADLIMEVRDLWPLTLIELGKVSPKHPFVILLKYFEGFGYKKAKYVVSLLSNAKEYMILRGMRAEKFQYIPNAIHIDEKEKSIIIENSIKEQIPKDKFIVGYMGSIGLANAMKYLIYAAEQLKDFKDIYFILVGEGSEKQDLMDYCYEKNIKNVKFIKQVQKLNVHSLIENFDICYIGWNKENMYSYGISANKIFDYMYSAKPILHSFGSKEADLIEQAGCGLTVEAENSQAIKNGILKLYEKDKAELKRIGENGREFVLKYHNYSTLAKQYINLFTKDKNES